MQAHKVILAAGSTLFRNILKKCEGNPHPLLYLRGVDRERWRLSWISFTVEMLDKCDDTFTTRNKLKDHEDLKHERVKYECDTCYDAFTAQNKLKDHEKLKLERVKYACGKCDDVFITQNKLKDHDKNGWYSSL